jgi:CheY-like chemotaxis protein
LGTVFAAKQGDEMSMEQWRQLRVLIAGQQHSFSDVLATNVQCLGYEAVILSSDLKNNSADGCDVEGDILLYDVDELLQRQSAEKDSSHLRQGIQTADILSDWEILQSRTRLTIVLSSSSVSRAMLERMGAIALLHKPFSIAQLQRYLSVLQRLLLPEQKQGQQTVISTYERAIRVLVVDDDKGVAKTVSECLSAEPGFVAAVAHNGLEALELCMDWHPQCVVTDLIMPWMNGYQMIHCLSAGMLRAMPAFVVMSALTRLEGPSDRAYLTERAVTYIDKPFQIDHLLRIIKQVCAG